MIKLATRSFSRKCSCNENFFKVWSPSMAYWLGMYFADGCVSSNKKDASLQLKCTDMKHVQKLKNSLSSTYEIGVYEQSLSKFCGVRHQICNPIIIHDLIDFGCIPRKTFHLQWPPKLPKEYENHFVRGYFDGDGCLCFRKQSHIMDVSFRGTEMFIKKMQECININVKQKANGCVSNQKNSWMVRYAGNVCAPAILGWMYKESEESIRLDRKYALFQKLKCIIDLPIHERLEVYTNYRESNEWNQYTICNYDKCPQNANKPLIELE